MIRVITTVGTSLFENFLEQNNVIRKHYDTIKTKLFSDYDNYKSEIEFIKKQLSSFVKNQNSSAEVKTLFKIKEYEKESLEVYFLCTDSIVSKVAAESIKEALNDVISIKGIYVIDGLQIYDHTKYDTVGFPNLISKFKELAINNSNSDKVILNISGGYKAIIPPMVILGQIYDIQLVYIYEQSEELIYFSSLPIHFDWSLAESYYPYLQEISIGKPVPTNELITEMLEMFLIRRVKSYYKITPLGKIFKDYIESEMPIANNTMGHFVEYKLFEYFNENPYEGRFNNVKHSKKIVNGSIHREIDLIMKDESTGEIVILESKSFLQINNPENFKKFKKQFESQLEILKNGGYKLYEYHLLIHHINYFNKDKIKSNLTKLNEVIKQNFNQEVKLKVFFYRVDLRLRDRNYFKNPYQKFLSQPVKLEEIKIS